MYAEELSNAVKPDYKPHVIREGDKWINDNKARRTGQCFYQILLTKLFTLHKNISISNKCKKI
jgi:hypothetical protein